MGRMGERSRMNIGEVFEKEIQKLWPDLGVQVVDSFRDRLSQRQYGDFQIVRDEKGQILNVDAKAEQVDHGNFPIEIMQDWPSNDIGWFYTLTSCDEIWYGVYTKDHPPKLKRVWRISMRRLRRLPSDVTSQFALRFCQKRQGETINVLAPLATLQEYGVAQLAWEPAPLQKVFA